LGCFNMQGAQDGPCFARGHMERVRCLIQTRCRTGLGLSMGHHRPVSLSPQLNGGNGLGPLTLGVCCQARIGLGLLLLDRMTAAEIMADLAEAAVTLELGGIAFGVLEFSIFQGRVR